MPTLTRAPERSAHDGPDATDPRFRARRASVAAERYLRRRRILRSTLALLTVAAVAMAALRSPLLDIDDITVHGAEHTSADAVTRASRLVVGLPLLDVDEAGAAARLAALPWVQAATVERSWWGSVDVRLTERTALAQIVDGDRYLVADRSGRVLAVAPTADRALITVEGTEAAEPGGQLGVRYAEVASIAAALGPGVRTRVVALRTTPAGQITLALRSRGTVLWGSVDQTDAKVRALTTVLGQVDLAGLCTIDVRVPTTPVVTRC